jgi:hypothetical protein
MTCAQLSGPCDCLLHGVIAGEVIQAQDHHLHEAVAQRDPSHEEALKDMKSRRKHPIFGMGWYKNTKRDFAERPAE